MIGRHSGLILLVRVLLETEMAKLWLECEMKDEIRVIQEDESKFHLHEHPARWNCVSPVA